LGKKFKEHKYRIRKRSMNWGKKQQMKIFSELGKDLDHNDSI
jgi:hypothetical protein